MSLNKPFSTVSQDYDEDDVLASGDEVYENVTTTENIQHVCEKTDTMSLTDAIPSSETQDVPMPFVPPLHNHQNIPPSTSHDTSFNKPPLNVTSQPKEKNPTIPPPPKDSPHNKRKKPRAPSTDSSSSSSSHSSQHRRSRSMHVPRDSHKRKKHSQHRDSPHHKDSENSTSRHSQPPTRSKTPPTTSHRSYPPRYYPTSRHPSDTGNRHSHHPSSGRETNRQRTPEIRDNNTRPTRPRRCFNCGKPGHLKKECRQPRRRLKTPQNQRAHCFVFKAPITNLHIHK